MPSSTILETAPRQAWETPRLIDLSTRDAHSGSPFIFEGVSVGASGTQFFYGPTVTVPVGS